MNSKCITDLSMIAKMRKLLDKTQKKVFVTFIRQNSWNGFQNIKPNRKKDNWISSKLKLLSKMLLKRNDSKPQIWRKKM